jgi:hypothetical protein
MSLCAKFKYNDIKEIALAKGQLGQSHIELFVKLVFCA